MWRFQEVYKFIGLDTFLNNLQILYIFLRYLNFYSNHFKYFKFQYIIYPTQVWKKPLQRSSIKLLNFPKESLLVCIPEVQIGPVNLEEKLFLLINLNWSDWYIGWLIIFTSHLVTKFLNKRLEFQWVQIAHLFLPIYSFGLTSSNG